MTVKYLVHNQLTGLEEYANDFEAAKILRNKLQADYVKEIVEPLFNITVMVQNENGSWTQSNADENGEPLIPAHAMEYLNRSTAVEDYIRNIALVSN